MHPHYPKRWQGMLLQFGRDEDHLAITYEFDEPLRRMVTPDNYKTQLRAIRPDREALGLSLIHI